ncbi:MAG: crossover junction endodeoxyribonuclease RuvC [Saprospiraceae bacterium]
MTDFNEIKILGIDPGTQIMGYAILIIHNSVMKVETLGVIKLKKYEDHQEKLKEIFLQTQEIIEIYGPRELAIEAPFFGKNVQSMLKLGRAQGVAIAAGITMGLNITEYSPKKVKQSITGNGNASKEQVAAMLQNMLKIRMENDFFDATDALGVAMCHYNQMSSFKSGNKKYSGWKSFITDNPNKIKK